MPAPAPALELPRALGGEKSKRREERGVEVQDSRDSGMCDGSTASGAGAGAGAGASD